MKGIAVVAVLFFLACANAHPISTFAMECLNITTGYPTRGNFDINTNVTLYFHFLDEFHDYNAIQFDGLILYHKRYFHILIVSEDQEITFHTHPDDYYDLSAVDPNTTVFHIDLNFPRGGEYSIAASFLYYDSINQTTREGFSQTTIDVNGGGLDPNPTFNLTTTNRFTNYPIGEDEIFNQWIDIKTNQVSEGYWATLTIVGSSAYNTSTTGPNATENYVPESGCTWMIVSVYLNESTMTDYATMIPYLAAPVHFTVSADDGGVYHAHGMYLPEGTSVFDVQKDMKGMAMSMMSSMDQSDPLYNLSMNAFMIGVTDEGTLDCLTDEGVVYDGMDGQMNMSLFYGPPTFTIVAGLLDFPVLGNWRLWAYMKMQVGDEERLFVPHFSINAYDDGASTTTSEKISGTTSASDASSIMIGLFTLLMALFVSM